MIGRISLDDSFPGLVSHLARLSSLLFGPQNVWTLLARLQKTLSICHISLRLQPRISWMNSVTKGICRQSFYPVEKCHLSLNKLSLDTAQCPSHQCTKMKRAKTLCVLSLKNYWLRSTICAGCQQQPWSRLSLGTPNTNSGVMNSFSRQIHFSGTTSKLIFKVRELKNVPVYLGSLNGLV